MSKNNNDDVVLKELLSNVKSQYKRGLVDAKLAYNAQYINNSQNKSKAAWDVIKGSCQNYEMNTKTSSISSDEFNKFYINSIANIKQNTGGHCLDATNLLKQSQIQNFENFSWKHITPRDVINAANSMSNSSSTDVYDMSNSLIKALISSIANPLTDIINLCLHEGVFPKELKISRICPVYKKGPKDEPASYRPVSIIPIISKLIEVLVYNQISYYFENNYFLNLSQFGFRKGRSTTGAMDDLVKSVLLVFENKACAQATFCDLSRAFECVDHKELIIKLKYYGVSDTPLRFF